MEALTYMDRRLHGMPPPSFLHEYLSYYAEPLSPLSPLDLSLKNSTTITPPCTPSPPRKRNKIEPNRTEQNNNHLNNNAIDDCKLHQNPDEDMPIEIQQQRYRSESAEITIIDDEKSNDSSPEAKKLKFSKAFFEDLNKSVLPRNRDRTPETNGRVTPEIDVVEVDERPRKSESNASKSKSVEKLVKKSKAVRRLRFDDDKTSPVSGTIIRDLDDDDDGLVIRKGDIDPSLNVVEITEEAKASIAVIENRLGSYVCRLCRRLYQDAFELAQHRCERIVHIEYRCPECDKVFNCPANLASHRRWHKPRTATAPKPRKFKESRKEDDEGSRYSCRICGKMFRRQAYLRKHYSAHEAFEPASTKEGPICFTSHSDTSVDGPQILIEQHATKYPVPLDNERSEFSAFRQVQSKVGDRGVREGGYPFWNKLPHSGEMVDSVSLYPFYHRTGTIMIPPPAILDIPSYASSHISSVISEESQTLDITGSEDEGDAVRAGDGAGPGAADD